MSYENAPATALVAQACCICGRALVEAESIASGIGPICAEKTGFGRPGLPPDVRAEVNRLVYELAAYQRSPEAVPRVARLRELGFEQLAVRVEARLAELVEIEIALIPGRRLVVELPRLEDKVAFDALLADLRTIPGRRWDTLLERGRKNTLPDEGHSIIALHRVLARHFAGRTAKSPRGIFRVPTVAELDALLARPRSRADRAA